MPGITATGAKFLFYQSKTAASSPSCSLRLEFAASHNRRFGALNSGDTSFCHVACRGNDEAARRARRVSRVGGGRRADAARCGLPADGGRRRRTLEPAWTHSAPFRRCGRLGADSARPRRALRLRARRGVATFSFRKNRIRGSLQSKVGEGFRAGRGGRSLRDRSALAERALGSRRISTRRLREGRNRRSRRQPADFVGNRQGKCLEILGKSLEKFAISLENLGFSLERLGKI